MSAIPRTTTESLHYGNHRWAIRVNGAGESHWSIRHGPENIYSDRRCNFCCSSVAPPVASLHGVASYDWRLDGADVGKLDCFRRSGRLELLRIKTPHAASLIAASCPCCAALKIGSKCLCWVIFDRSGRFCLPVHVRFAPKSDVRPGAESVTANPCHWHDFPPSRRTLWDPRNE